MDAIQSSWTRPFFIRNQGRDFEIEDFEILTTVLSALKWREKNGRIKMLADKTAQEYYKKLGILGIWNQVEELSVPGFIDPDAFWAAGKLYALKNQKAPIVMIDTDFIVWEKINFELIKYDGLSIHREPLYPDVYPCKEAFSMRSEYNFDDEWDWEQSAYNTALVYIKSEAFLKYYTLEAIRFMENAEKPDNFLTYMVFAEQRLFGMCAGKGYRVGAFSDIDRLFEHGEGCFTHIWGLKEQMRRDSKLKEAFCTKCAHRILHDFPYWAKVLEKNSDFYKYF